MRIVRWWPTSGTGTHVSDKPVNQDPQTDGASPRLCKRERRTRTIRFDSAHERNAVRRRSRTQEDGGGSGRNMGAAQKLLEAEVGAEGIEARVDEDEGKHGARVDSFFEHCDGVVMITQSNIYAGDAKYVMVQEAI